MSNLKDTDIDDLFRRASEKYPLRTDSSDWDRMVAALEKDPPPPDDETDATDRRRKRRFFWLFFLLPLGVGGLGYYAWHSGARTHTGATAKASVAANTPDASNTPVATNTTDKTNTPASANTPSATGTSAANPTAASRTLTPATPTTTAGGTTAAAGLKTRGDRSLLANTGYQANADRQINDNNQGNANRRGKAGHSTNAGGAFAGGSTGVNTSVSGNNSVGGNSSVSANTGGGTDAQTSGNPFSTSLTQSRQDRLFYDLLREPVDRSYQLNVNVVAPAAKKDSAAAKQKTSAKTKTSYLYAGLLGAPDISTVKMQAVKQAGNTFGVLVGYAFNSHWAIETGAYLDRKKYYTEGQYFNTKEINWLTSADTLKNVNGTCYMWEIPLNLRYTINPEAKTRWFVTAGFTTYLMTKEKYTYNYAWSGWNLNKTGILDSSSHYPFSIIGLSAGFEQKLGKVGNLRIEPYLRIPLTGMGAGKLPIMSTGINIGITRQLWKK
jgi:Outer membrane protein beta-barrel domain